MREKDFLPLVSSRLGIDSINDMQRKMLDSTHRASDGIMLLAPTGSGKTLAFSLPVLKMLKPAAGHLQALVVAPGRELVSQIAGILRKLAPGYRILTLYGGHAVSDEIKSLSVIPEIVVATPGRLLDHINRRNIDVISTRIVVLDEFDKSLSLGFEDEMRRIFTHLKNVSRVILTSATEAPSIPEFVPVSDLLRLDYLDANRELKKRIPVYVAETDSSDKLVSLLSLLVCLSPQGGNIGRTVVFVNHRESASRVNEWLIRHGATSEVYHGALDQQAREKALALFRAGSKPILISTDLGARGLDVDDVDNVIHYHLPPTQEDWIHRNGRTARAGREGHVYVLKSPSEFLPDYMTSYESFGFALNAEIEERGKVLSSSLSTLRVGAGRREKISRADLLGWLVKECGVPGDEIGRLEVSDYFSLATMSSVWANYVLRRGKNQRIKGSNRRITPA